jgi:hypothetical protein
MLRLSVAAGMIGKTSFFKDVSHFNTMSQIALKNSMWGVRQSFNNLSILYKIPQPRIYSKLTRQQSSKQGVVSCKSLDHSKKETVATRNPATVLS